MLAKVLFLVLCSHLMNQKSTIAVTLQHEEVGSALSAWFKNAISNGLDAKDIDLFGFNTSSISSSIFKFQKLTLNFSSEMRESETAILKNRFDGIHIDYQLPTLTYKFEVSGAGDKDTYPVSICSQCARNFILKLTRARENSASLELVSLKGRPSMCGLTETEVTPLFMIHRRSSSYVICSPLDEYRANIINSAIKISDIMSIIDPLVAERLEQTLRSQDNLIVVRAIRDFYKFHGVDIFKYD